MKLTYIFHSGFVLENDNFSMIIDYYKDSNEDNDGIVHQKVLKNNKKLYILCTHSHQDHFNPEILEWKKQRNDIVYIFSKDILDNKMATEGDAIYMDKLDTYKDGILSIQAFGSTDLGISFLIKADDKTIFHAGDLNNWHWNEESTEEEINEAENYYNDELTLLSEHVQHLDLVMFPIDIRLGKDYMKGAEQFLNTIETDIFVPMHFGNNYGSIVAFADFAIQKRCNSISWKYKGQSIEF
ncbi:MBL fold metallo-hydrolase [Dysgonomonas sp. Marseille-P4361]|uniref:MBL fold metallo-hydrolase n=1 Tax=Dysgonomonas sp. Marseille-P4361 TaxID=2161820 RepID=UPI000D55076E|nr:MBL fold metallo-hydrolase [Dysgonomonas sp. Marseille-P4361]